MTTKKTVKHLFFVLMTSAGLMMGSQAGAAGVGAGVEGNAGAGSLGGNAGMQMRGNVEGPGNPGAGMGANGAAGVNGNIDRQGQPDPDSRTLPKGERAKPEQRTNQELERTNEREGGMEDRVNSRSDGSVGTN